MNSPSQETLMPPSIWSQTPDHIVDRILAFLPLHHLLRLRSVCKPWSADLLHTPTFRRLHSQSSPPQRPWFLVSSIHRRFTAFNPNLHKWHQLTVPTLPDPGLKPLVSSHSLICYGEDSSTTDLYICNPITGEWRHLSPHPEKTVDHLGMHYDEKTRSYKMLTVNVGVSMIRRVTMYDSRVDRWRDCPLPRSTTHLSKAAMVWRGNCVYFMDRMRPFCALHAFDVESSTWRELHAAAPQFFDVPSLVACNERLFMVGLRRDGFKIWEVVEKGGELVECVEYDSLPELLPNEFGARKKGSVGAARCANYNPFRLGVVGGCCGGDVMCFGSNLDRSWVLLYDVRRKAFVESRNLAQVRDRAGVCEHAYLAFQPCLDVSP